MDVASAGMAISTVDNAVMVAASTCTCFFSELLGGNNQRQPGDPYPRQLHSCRRKAPYLARTTTGRLTRVAARLAFMETMVQSGEIRVSICIILGAIDCAIPVRLAERFSTVPTRCTSTSSVRSSSTNHHPGRGEAFPRQPLLPSTTVDPDSFTSVRLDGCQGGEVHRSVPRVPPLVGGRFHPHLCFPGRSCAQAWPWRGSWYMRWRP